MRAVQQIALLHVANNGLLLVAEQHFERTHRSPPYIRYFDRHNRRRDEEVLPGLRDERDRQPGPS
jgi:hypothetical protein